MAVADPFIFKINFQLVIKLFVSREVFYEYVLAETDNKEKNIMNSDWNGKVRM